MKKRITAKLFKHTATVMTALLIMLGCAGIFENLFVTTVYADTASVNNVSYIPPNGSTSTNYLVIGDSDRDITDSDRNAAYTEIVNYINALTVTNNLSDTTIEQLNAIFYQMNVYVATTHMTLGQLNDIVKATESNLSAACTAGSESMVFMANDVSISSGYSGGSCVVNVGLINLGSKNITNLVITPAQSNDPSKWPFVIKTASDARVISTLNAGSSLESAYEGKQTVSWTFTVSGDAKTGLYPLQFDYQYYSNGQLKTGSITTFAKITGNTENGKLIDNGDNAKTSTPRIVVTGFTTDPEVVNAGDTFTLNIEIENTSSTETVSNIQFDLKATPVSVGSGATLETIDPFLPTSGSSTIYVDKISPKGTTTLTMEMTARADLSQKPYVVNVAAKYEDTSNSSYEASADVSIPVQQEARVETSDFEVLPDYIMVGESSNIMFDVYNMGKTTLYNVQVAFDDTYVSGGSKFLGQIAPGATGAVDVDITGIAPCYDGFITCTVTYEDEAGNATVIEKQVTMMIDEFYYDDSMDDYGFYDDGMMPEEGEGGPNIPLIAGIIIAVIAAIIAGVIISKKKKEKREARKRELEELEKNDTLL